MILRMAFVSFLMVATALATVAVQPRMPQQEIVAAPDLEAMLPDEFADWRRVFLSEAVLPTESDLGADEAVAYRAYADEAGRVVTLVVAYGPPLGDSVRLHRPEACYVAQGFVIKDRRIESLTLSGDELPVIRLVTENSLRNEAVSYWLRDGDAFVGSAAGHEILNLKRGLAGTADGALVRVSTSGVGEAAFELQEIFLQNFADALDPDARALLMARS